MEDRKDNTLYIVTPVLNAEEQIDRTIQSVLTQAGEFKIRYHVQDGGSTDGTVSKIQTWLDIVDTGTLPTIERQRIEMTYNSESDNGMYDAISKGVTRMKIGEPHAFMSWLNAGDELTPNALSAVDRISSMEDVQWIGSYPCVWDNLSKLIFYNQVAYPKEAIQAGLCDATNWPTIHQAGSFWRVGLWNEVGGVDCSFKLAGDWDLWRRFAAHKSFHLFDYPLGVCHKNGNPQAAKDKEKRYANEIDRTLSSRTRQNAAREIVSNLWGKTTKTVVSNKTTYAVREQSITQTLLPAALKKGNAKLGNITNNSASTICSPLPPAIDIQKIISHSQRSLSKTQLEQLQILRNSELFLYQYYISNEKVPKGEDPLVYYLLVGKGNPNPLFDSQWYLETFPDVMAAKLNPLFHYVQWGAKEGFDPHPAFSTEKYMKANPEILKININPLAHYLSLGAAQGVSIKKSVYG